ncbi:Peptidoglycan/xylan/chitin deacetylase, PgdA/CDA1 family [Chitinophaga jiangningensis]|uniref:Peptidoglycan/xylan/chitin deacetylase, PgdA/CDA1 family n=1 Tax=Chitinophaga jiangningensis TaxID=1419482 RepID=A0A1M7C2R3_9BACT|nr:polysaccharide deacetylase family protein [Chitinophaga jiangningensis]SHL61453.1 Peptidoglycan/xylan/chitin deacetylase, PgdA/CDA1 family [Chitinophaga jiangningensis]
MKQILLTVLYLLGSLSAVCQQGTEIKEIPVLCYHHIYEGTNEKNDLLHISVAQFEQQLQALAANGYQSITPDILAAYLQGQAVLPTHPVLITFDDSHATHYTLAAPALKHFGFTGVFFVMTVTINKAGYLSAQQISSLATAGHFIGCHTWDHQPLMKGSINWHQQLNKPKSELEQLTGKPVISLAYPYGIWDSTAIAEVKAVGFKAAFQLNKAPDKEYPIYTIRRLMVSGAWSGTYLIGKMETVFSH